MAGVSARGISDIERGISRRPRLDTIKLLAKALDLQGVDLARFVAVARGRAELPLSGEGQDDAQTIARVSPFVSTDYIQPTITVRVSGAARNETSTKSLQPQEATATIVSLPVPTEGMILVIVVKVVVVVLLILLAVVITRLEQSGIPPIAQSTPVQTEASDTQGPSVLDVMGGLQLSLMPRAADGTLFVETGQPVTATFRLYNTGAEIATLEAIRVGARGPGACVLEWSAPVVDFPAVTNVTLRPGESYLYQQTRSFVVPGVYFAEPVKLGIEPGVGWGGIRPFPRVWFRVVDARTHQLPDRECITAG